ncbi:hypothetical protein VitviT2T_011589 [Vitis vinifera]|uniref:Reverse transcriptase RNase H-like domain-containing protein n=1 Tax=Vitis vinifera TaxID=29760 RepID=A0ABY9CCY2_VITVI|nr:hypothetical protein VitviT2T_011589 [Vitis vinifera]
MLAQLDDSGKERAIYYLSKRMLDYGTSYVMIERYCLALVWATRRLRHYMTKYSMHLISRLDPLGYLFDRPTLVGRLMRWSLDDLRYTYLPRAQNQFADALITLASMIDIPADTIVRPLLIESRSIPTYYCLIDEVDFDDGLPWYHDIYQFMRLDTYPEVATTKDKRALRQLVA